MLKVLKFGINNFKIHLFYAVMLFTIHNTNIVETHLMESISAKKHKPILTELVRVIRFTFYLIYLTRWGSVNMCMLSSIPQHNKV